MKKLSFTFLFLILLLAACSSSGTTTETVVTITPAPTRTAIATKTVIATTTAVATTAVATKTAVVPAREAVVTYVENDVVARALSSENFSPVSTGMSINPNDRVETGIDGHARIDLLPEGTIMRVGANSSITIIEINRENGQPKTTIDLLFGKIFILLNGGSLDITTSTGVASASDSLMRVDYDPQIKLLKVSCLEGHCILKNKNDAAVELISGEFSSIEGDQPPTDPEKIYREEIQEWMDEIPELPYFLAELPDPEDYPMQNPKPTYVPTPTRRPRSYPNP